jgi:hypothetical protein
MTTQDCMDFTQDCVYLKQSWVTQICKNLITQNLWKIRREHELFELIFCISMISLVVKVILLSRARFPSVYSQSKSFLFRFFDRGFIVTQAYKIGLRNLTNVSFYIYFYYFTRNFVCIHLWEYWHGNF